MITVEKALQLLDTEIVSGPAQQVLLKNALGLTLAQDVYSPIDMPPFAQSAMDGFAVKFHQNSNFTNLGEIQAGDNKHPELLPGNAVRIFTGAAVPATADAVVRQEDCTLANNSLKVNSLPKVGANIRPKGEQIKSGETALKKGHVLGAASIGFLASLGIEKLMVYRPPKVAVLITGNELAIPGAPLKYGQIYESNGIMLAAALQKNGIADVEIIAVKDHFEQTKIQLKNTLKNCDVLICSGGISVGDYDFVGKALIDIGVKEVFYKVMQKPGKPLFFGKLDHKLIFALPGNPAAALTCFYVYVIKALYILMGKNSKGLPRVRKKITETFIRNGDRAQFLKAAICGNEVAVLEDQSSAMLNTFALANALIYVPLEIDRIEKSVEVDCILI